MERLIRKNNSKRIVYFVLCCSVGLFYQCSLNKQLYGTWVGVDSSLTVKFENNNKMIFIIDEIATRTIEYQLKENYLYFTNEIKGQDSIKIVSIEKDELILTLKDKGLSKESVFKRIE